MNSFVLSALVGPLLSFGNCTTFAFTSRFHVGVCQNQWYHFGVGAPPMFVYFSGHWDVHLGYDLAFDPWPGHVNALQVEVCRAHGPRWPPDRAFRACQARPYAGSWGVCDRALLEGAIWVWVTIKPTGDRRFWSMFPLTRVPFGVPIFDPQPFWGGLKGNSKEHCPFCGARPHMTFRCTASSSGTRIKR